ncbi:MAG TPA: branched-chain amino acid ABC transporter permease [Ktedonobacterales bacterium]|nr:branched-chain amino acid ABC transporter permease [Ktedonobacterales bacterium]
MPFGYLAQPAGAGTKQRQPLGEVAHRERIGHPYAERAALSILTATPALWHHTPNMTTSSCLGRQAAVAAHWRVEGDETMTALLQVVLAGLVTGSLYGLLALGIVLIYRTTGVLNFAYGTIAAVCACFMYVLMTGPKLGFVPALLITLIFAVLLGMALERLFARPVLHAPIFTKVIATLALALVLQTLAQTIWPQLTQPVHFSSPFEGRATRIGGVYISLVDVMVLVVTALIMIGLSLFLSRTRVGIALRATADNLAVARLMGVPAGTMFLLVWALSAVVAALTGILFASQQSQLDVQFMDPVLILAFVGAVLGGLESLPGALLGGILVGLADNVLALALAGHHIGALNVSDPGIRETLIFVGFVLLLLFRPQGILGQALLRRV